MLDLRSRDDGSSRSSIYRKRSYRKDVINKRLWRRAAHRLDSWREMIYDKAGKKEI